MEHAGSQGSREIARGQPWTELAIRCSREVSGTSLTVAVTTVLCESTPPSSFLLSGSLGQMFVLDPLDKTLPVKVRLKAEAAVDR